MAREPRVRLDRERVAAEGLFVALDRRREAVAVALSGEVPLELRDEQAPVREDQDAERPCRLDEARGRDRLSGGGRVAEAVAARRAGVGAAEARLLVLLLVQHVLRRVLLGLGFLLDSLDDGAVAVRRLLVRGDQLREHSGERVDLMASQLGARGEVRLRLGEYALEPEHQAPLDLPGGGGLAPAALDLGDGVVERAPAGRAGRKRDARVLALPEEGLAR